MTSELKARMTDWLNAFKADPFSTGADKVDRLFEVLAEYHPPAPDKQLTDVVEKCRDRFAEYVELHRAKLTDDAVLNVREAIWRKVEHNQEMVRMCDEALASLNTAPAGDDVRLPEHATEPMVEAGLIELGKWLGVRPDEIDDLVVGSVWIVMWRAALKATTHTEEKAK
jgi:hypothetical protein